MDQLFYNVPYLSYTGSSIKYSFFTKKKKREAGQKMVGQFKQQIFLISN